MFSKQSWLFLHMTKLLLGQLKCPSTNGGKSNTILNFKPQFSQRNVFFNFFLTVQGKMLGDAVVFFGIAISLP